MKMQLRYLRAIPSARAPLFDLDLFSVGNILSSVPRAGRTLALAQATSDRLAHWLLRLPLAALIWGYGIDKFPAALTNPGDFGVPAILYTLNAFGEVLGVIALLAGGVIETWDPARRWLRRGGDLLTRAAGFALGAAVGGVIAFFFLETITLSNPHSMQLGLALYFLFRGNRLRA